MQISFNFDTSNAADVAALTTVLASLDKAVAKPAAPDAVQKMDATPAAEPVAETAPEPVAEKPKRGRKPKEQAAAPVVEEDAPQAEPQAEPQVDEPQITHSDPAVFTLDEVRSALQQYTAAKGIGAGVALLKEFGAGRISELAEGDYASFVAGCAL